MRVSPPGRTPSASCRKVTLLLRTSGDVDSRCRTPGGAREQHLLNSVSERGDALDAVRRCRPRTPAAELVWQLLPPPADGTDRFRLSGSLEPADTVGGDAFDDALSRTSVSLAVFDALGHGLPAGLMAAATLSAYRSARRNGHGLLAQGRAVDQTLAALHPDSVFVTGFLGELNLTSGPLRYLCTGHPCPMLLRAGKIVHTVAGGRGVPSGPGDLGQADDAAAARAPYAADDPASCDDPAGLDDVHPADGGSPPSVGEQDLQPGEWLVVHTDGVTAARDATGAFFGDARLVDFLERSAAAGQPPPETARRLAHAVLQHQDGQLQDDATALLGCWLGR